MINNVLIVDDHSVFVKGLENVLLENKSVKVVGNAKNGIEALEIIKNSEINILITDIEMPEMDGFDLIFAAKKIQPDIKIIVITYIEKPELLSLIKKELIESVILKKDNPQEINIAFSHIMNGEKYFSKEIRETALNTLFKTKPVKPSIFEINLSEREQKVLDYIVHGYTNKEIARELFKSEQTIESQRKSLFNKFGVNNAAALAAKAVKMKFSDPCAPLN